MKNDPRRSHANTFITGYVRFSPCHVTTDLHRPGMSPSKINVMQEALTSLFHISLYSAKEQWHDLIVYFVETMRLWSIKALCITRGVGDMQTILDKYDFSLATLCDGHCLNRAYPADKLIVIYCAHVKYLTLYNGRPDLTFNQDK